MLSRSTLTAHVRKTTLRAKGTFASVVVLAGLEGYRSTRRHGIARIDEGIVEHRKGRVEGLLLHVGTGVVGREVVGHRVFGRSTFGAHVQEATRVAIATIVRVEMRA